MSNTDFFDNKEKRIGGDFDLNKSLFDISVDGNNYALSSVDDIIDANDPAIKFSKKININSIAISTIENKLKVNINNDPQNSFTSDSLDDCIYIINILRYNRIFKSYFLYIDYGIGNKQNTFISRNSISCDYNIETELCNLNLNNEEYTVEVHYFVSYCNVNRYETKSFEHDMEKNYLSKNIVDEANLIFDDTDKTISISSSNLNELNSIMLEYNYKDISAIDLREEDLDHENIYLSVDGEIKDATILIDSDDKMNSNYNLADIKDDYKGELAFKFYKGDSLVMQFSLYVDKSNSLFIFKDFIISDSNYENHIEGTYLYGTSLRIYDVLELSLKDIKVNGEYFYDKVSIDYNKFNIRPNLKKYNFIDTNTYLIQNNSSSYYGLMINSFVSKQLKSLKTSIDNNTNTINSIDKFVVGEVRVFPIDANVNLGSNYQEINLTNITNDYNVNSNGASGLYSCFQYWGYNGSFQHGLMSIPDYVNFWVYNSNKNRVFKSYSQLENACRNTNLGQYFSRTVNNNFQIVLNYNGFARILVDGSEVKVGDYNYTIFYIFTNNPNLSFYVKSRTTYTGTDYSTSPSSIRGIIPSFEGSTSSNWTKTVNYSGPIYIRVIDDDANLNGNYNIPEDDKFRYFKKIR